jgi:hypothetical protein
MRQLTNAHTEYVLDALVNAEQIQRIFPNGGGSLEFFQRMISDMDIMLELRDKVQNHIKFNEITEINFGWINVE